MKQMLAMLAASAVVIGAVVFFAVERNQSVVLHLEGEITAIRFNTLSDGGDLAILNLKVKNPTTNSFEVHDMEIEAVAPDKKVTPSGALSKRELASYAEYEKLPGTPIGLGDVFKKGETKEGIVSARFEVPRDKLSGQTIVVRFHSVNRVVAEITGRIP
jgi:hypothetical protein